ncbi:HepT-like ribonuclease domain-containing protein [Rhodoflexus sp.]
MAKSRNDLVFLEDILDSIEKIEFYVQSFTEAEFEKSSEKQDAVIRRLEIIGEAVKNLSDTIRNTYPHVRWRQIAGMRDVLIHQYFGVTIGLVWRVITSDLPILKEVVKEIIDDMVKDK